MFHWNNKVVFNSLTLLVPTSLKTSFTIRSCSCMSSQSSHDMCRHLVLLLGVTGLPASHDPITLQSGKRECVASHEHQLVTLAEGVSCSCWCSGCGERSILTAGRPRGTGTGGLMSSHLRGRQHRLSPIHAGGAESQWPGPSAALLQVHSCVVWRALGSWWKRLLKVNTM